MIRNLCHILFRQTHWSVFFWTLIVLSAFCAVQSHAEYLEPPVEYGCAGTQLDPNLIDPDHNYEVDGEPLMEAWASAGVQGGIPEVGSIPVKATVNAGASGSEIQSAIDSGGKGVVLLKNGDYRITETLQMKSDVILRGESRNGVKLNIDMNGEHTYDRSKAVVAIRFGNKDSYAGLEDLTIEYVAPGQSEKENWDFQVNKNYGNDTYVETVDIVGDNNWLDRVTILYSGTNPVRFDDAAQHNTMRNCKVDQCWNKGGGGAGYLGVRGQKNLITGNEVTNIRHFAWQFSAKFNVIINNYFEVDINPHNGDDGYSLFEDNKSRPPSSHFWGVIATGGSKWGHDEPGPRNYLFNNDFVEKGDDVMPDRDAIYTLKHDDYDDTPFKPSWGGTPLHGTLYAVKMGDGLRISSPSPSSSKLQYAGNPVEVTVANNGEFDYVELFVDGDVYAADSAEPCEFTVTGLAEGSHDLLVQGPLAATGEIKDATATFDVISRAGILATDAVRGDPSAPSLVPENTLDGDISPAARWSAESDDTLTPVNPWIRYQLDDTYNLTEISLSFFKGNERTYTFDVQTSSDGSTWTDIATGLTSSGTTTGLETFPVSGAGSWVRIIGYGNSNNDWNSYKEVVIDGIAGDHLAITNPSNQDTINLGEDVSVTTQAFGEYDYVELYIDGTPYATDITAPYDFTVQGLGEGEHTLSVEGQLTAGGTISDSVSINVVRKVTMAAVDAARNDGGGHVAANTTDGSLDPDSRWSADSDNGLDPENPWIEFELDNTYDLSTISIAFYRGDQRTYTFDVQISQDGSNWTNVLTNQISNGSTLDLEDFAINGTASWIRIVGKGNSSNSWNSYTEVEIEGSIHTVEPTLTIMPEQTDGIVGSDVNVASDYTGTFEWVVLIVDGFLTAIDHTEPYEFSLSGLGEGPHTLSLGGQASSGELITSGSVDIEMLADVQLAGIAAVDAARNDGSGHVAANTTDGSLDPDSRWSADSDNGLNPENPWIEFELDNTYDLSTISIAFYRGDQRTYTFDVQISQDGSNWTNVLTNQTSNGSTLDLEDFAISGTASWVRIVGHGNSSNSWNSITEIEIEGSA